MLKSCDSKKICGRDRRLKGEVKETFNPVIKVWGNPELEVLPIY